MQSDDIVKSALISKNITVLGHRTSVRLEPQMWKALQEISSRENCKIHDICSLVALRKKPKSSLTAAIRVFLMLYYRAAATEEGHFKAGHGNFTKMLERARLNDAVQNNDHETKRDIAIVSTTVSSAAGSKEKNYHSAVKTS